MIDQLLNKWIDFVRDHIYVITILIFASLIVLVLVQYNLIKLEMDIQRHQFDKEIDAVLWDMHHRIEDDETISNQLIDLIGDRVHPVSRRDSMEQKLTTAIRSFTDILNIHGKGYILED